MADSGQPESSDGRTGSDSPTSGPGSGSAPKDSGRAMNPKAPKTPISQDGTRQPASKTRRGAPGRQPAPQRGPRGQAIGQGQRPEHPNGAAALLMIGIVVLLVLIAVFSTFGGR